MYKFILPIEVLHSSKALLIFKQATHPGASVNFIQPINYKLKNKKERK